MNHDEFLDLAIKILGDEASREEYDEFRLYLENKEYADRFDIISKDWNNARQSMKKVDFDVNEGFENFLSRTKQLEQKLVPEKKQFKIYLLFQNSVFVRAAASIAFVFIISTIILYYLGLFNGKSNTVVWNEKITQLGEKSILTFLDGTKITLNAGSKLKYLHGSETTQREVFLEGEAFFEITRDISRPFIVHTSNISTTVLGTKFDVCAYSVDREIIVSLVEGSVKVSKSTSERKEDIVILNPEQQLRYSKDEEISRVRKFDEQEATGWKDNVLKFTNEPLNKALIKLERFYGVKFELTKKSAANIKITANFKGDSFHTVAEVIKKLTGLKYKTVTDKYEIKKVIFY